MRVKAILKGGLHEGLVIDIEDGQSGIKVLHPIDETSVKGTWACYQRTDETEAGVPIYRHFRDIEEEL